LRCFLSVAEEMNFSRAATRMHMTQPALSAQIRGLERQLGFALFNRTTRRVDLTESGAAFLAHARRVIEESDRLQHAAKDLRRGSPGRMHLGAAFYTIDIPERVSLLEGFFERHPNVPIDVSPAWQNALLADLQRGRIDAALLLGLPVSRHAYATELADEPAAETIIPDDLPRLVLRREQAGLLVPRELPMSQLDPIPVAALLGLRVATLGSAHGKAVVEPIRSLLEMAGATSFVPPEPHAVGVERYGRQFRIPTVTLGWFGGGARGDESMVRRSLEGLQLTTEFSVVRSPVSTNPAINLLWEQAREQAEHSASARQLNQATLGGASTSPRAVPTRTPPS
jgi:DNA-binding transcriptional LysR family regulator